MLHLDPATTEASARMNAQFSPGNDPARPKRAGREVSSLRIGIFVSEFPALSETFVLRQVTGLLARGHDVTVFADRPRDEPVTHPDFQRYGLAARTRYLEMPHNRVARVLSALGALSSSSPSQAFALLKTLNPLRHRRDAFSLRLFHWALQLAREERFDVLHCHFGPVGSMVCSLRDLGAVEGPVATTFHGADLTACLRARPNRYRELARRGDMFLPISEYMADRLQRLGCPPFRISVHRMGVDLDRFDEVPRLAGSGPLRLLTVGRLAEKKGIADALYAVAEARRRGVNLTYTLIGDGPLRNDLLRMVRNLDIGDVVNFEGWQVQEAVIEALYTHDVLLAPSVTASDGDQEGIPVTIMEAMATGMPVISTYHSGIPELVENGVSGLLAEEHDVPGLAEAIQRLAGDPDLAREIGQAGRQRVAEEYDATKLDDLLHQRFRDLAARI